MGYCEKKIFFTDIDMVRDKKSPYKIILPVKSTETEMFAAKELKKFFEIATGARLQILDDSNALFNADQYYFSIGNTQLFYKLNIDLKQTAYSDDVFLFSKGNMIFFNGSGKGSVFAVYELLNILFNYRYYAKDEFYINMKRTLKVPVLDVKYVPDIHRRSLGFYDTEKVSEHVYRLKLGNTLYSGWIEHCHTYFKILPKDKYYKSHPDWYSTDGKNLCLSNEEMKEEFIRRVEEIIEKKEGDLFMLGQEDTFDFCGCEKCQKKIAQYGVASGLVMEFSNDVATKVGQWLSENYPERQIKFVVFAYNMTFKPPVRFNECKGRYEPIKKTFVAAPNIAIMVVPYNAIYSCDYLDSKNQYVKEGLWGWQAVCKDLMIWSYCTIYQNYMLPFNNFSALKKNYEILKEIGVSFLYDGASHDTNVPCFEELKQFLHANLMWDTSCDTEKLISEFMNAYYKEAAPYMNYILELWRTRWNLIENAYQKFLYAFDSFNDLMDRKYWSKQFVESLEEAYSCAFASIKENRQHSLLADRILKEYMTVQFLKIYLYPELVSDLEEEKKRFKENRVKFNVCHLQEAGDGVLWDEKQ